MGRPRKIKIVEKTPEQIAEEQHLLQKKWDVEDRKEEKEKVDALLAEDNKKRAKAKAEAEAAIQLRKEKAAKEKEALLKKPLTVQETDEYGRYYAMAMSSTQPPDVIMFKLAEFRTRLRNNGVKNPK